MPRNLVVCCDGTDNEFQSVNTNVVRLVQVAVQDPRQLVYYDPGVGTLPEPGVWTRAGKRMTALLDSAFALALNRRIEAAYGWLTANWQPGDRIYLFGFSRGAYTVRVVAGLLHAIGLLPHGSNNLLPYMMRLFSAAGRNRREYWRLLNSFGRTFSRGGRTAGTSRTVPTHFLGLWDTVASVGWVWEPVTFPYTTANRSIATIRHAMALDERRWFFRQHLMTPQPRQDVVQMWFSGVHSDIGGGYPLSEGRLWQYPFAWLLEEARQAGLLIDDERLQHVLPNGGTPDDDAWRDAPHESLTRRWWPLEYFPKMPWREEEQRHVLQLGKGRSRSIKPGALLHASVIRRLQEIASYQPPNLSPAFREHVKTIDATTTAYS